MSCNFVIELNIIQWAIIDNVVEWTNYEKLVSYHFHAEKIPMSSRLYQIHNYTTSTLLSARRSKKRMYQSQNIDILSLPIESKTMRETTRRNYQQLETKNMTLLRLMNAWLESIKPMILLPPQYSQRWSCDLGYTSSFGLGVSSTTKPRYKILKWGSTNASLNLSK